MDKKKSLLRLRSPPLLSRKSQTLTSSTISRRCLRRRRLLWRRPSSTSCSTRTTAVYPPAPRTASGSTTATPSVRSSAATSTARRRDRRRGDALPLQHPGARWRRGEPQYPPNKLMIWDDHQSRCIGELSFRLEVRAVRLRRDRIVVVLEQTVFVYNFADLKLMQQIETVSPRKGLCAVSQAAATSVLVCPGTQKGQVRVENYSSKRTKFIAAHDSRVACFALTTDGRLLATASSKGTLVRIFNTGDGALLQEENSITTTKYNILTFLPKGLFEQFRRVANLYFCMISILSTTPIRPTKPVSWWEDSSNILGGRDCLAGGTWLGCTRAGRLAFLTNFREPDSIPKAKSRGELPVHFLEDVQIKTSYCWFIYLFIFGWSNDTHFTPLFVV